MSASSATLPATDARWELAAEEHRVALAAYVRSAAALDEVAWGTPWAAGKWTPAHITEHLSLAYEALLAELAGGGAMQPRLAGWRLRLARWVVLPHILFHGTLPLRAAAPRETRPSRVRAPRPAALRALEELGERFEEELGRAFRAGRGTLSHPYFGALGPVKALRFVAVHVNHHRAQVERAG